MHLNVMIILKRVFVIMQIPIPFFIVHNSFFKGGTGKKEQMIYAYLLYLCQLNYSPL